MREAIKLEPNSPPKFFKEEYNPENFDFDEDLLDYEHEEIDVVGTNNTQQQLDYLLPGEPITTAQRLEKWPEMYQIAAPKRRKMPVEYRKMADPIKIIRTEIPLPKDEEKVKTHSICDECTNWFRCPTILATHKESHQHGEKTIPMNFVCPIIDCTVRCDIQTTLNEHVRVAHQRNDMVYENMHFPSFVEFQRWKEDLEYNTASRYIQSSARYTYAGKSTRLVCYFTKPTGNLPSKARGIRMRSSKKHTRSCTSYMTVKEVYGQIHVRACLTHLGHEDFIHNLPLSITIKREIAGALIRGMGEEQILRTYRESTSTDDRRFFVRPYEIRNIYRKLVKSQRVQAEIRESICGPKKEPTVSEEVPPAIAEEEVV